VPAGINLSDFYYLLPEIVLTTGALLLLLADLMTPRDKQSILAWVTLAVLGATAAALVPVAGVNIQVSRGLIAVDSFALFFKVIFLGSAALTVLMSVKYLDVEGTRAGEYYFLILCATLGMMFMAGGTDLITLFIGLETMAISFYILTGFLKPSRRSNEAAVKYFLLGAFSLGILLYGMSLMYGLSGSTNLRAIATALAGQESDPRLVLAVILVVGGMGFKIAAVPFHMWAPDVYEGAPTPITGYMAAAVKGAAFAAFLRVWLEAFGNLYPSWHAAVWWLSAITMVVGNLVALQQRNLKRMLAYSSIGHTGFILVAVAAGTTQSASAFLFYLLAYTLATMGAFATIIALGTADTPREKVEDYHGLWFEQPGTAVAMTVFMLALLGFPIFGGMGFFAKWYVLQAALDAPAPQTRLSVLLVLTTTISAGYYLYVVMVMYMKPRPENAPPLPVVGGISRTVIVASMLFLLAFGVYPEPVVRWTRAAATLSRAPAPPVMSQTAAPGSAAR